MNNQDAIGDGSLPETRTYKAISVGDTASTSGHVQIYSTGTSGYYPYTAPQTLTAGQTFTWTLPSATVTTGYHMYWGDERKDIPGACRCNADMNQPHEDHIYIKKIWFCSIKCYEEWMVACIGTDIDE